MRISIIGFGNMSKYLSHGLLTLKDCQIQAASPSLSIATTEHGIHTHHDNTVIVPLAEVIILAVKPAQMKTVLAEIQPYLSPAQLIITIAAGLRLSWYNQHLPNSMPVIRAIPNLAAKIGQSATPLLANSFVTASQRHAAEQIFLSSGIITWVEQENELDAYTALSGSGPAYLFLWMNAMAKAAIRLGLPEATATEFAIQTVKGAATLAATENKSLMDLQHAVTSTGGTTAAALEVFQAMDLEGMVLRAMTAADDRSKKMGAEQTS